LHSPCGRACDGQDRAGDGADGHDARDRARGRHCDSVRECGWVCARVEGRLTASLFLFLLNAFFARAADRLRAAGARADGPMRESRPWRFGSGGGLGRGERGRGGRGRAGRRRESETLEASGDGLESPRRLGAPRGSCSGKKEDENSWRGCARAVDGEGLGRGKCGLWERAVAAQFVCRLE